jgi:predicted lipid-binding transport protein (Tim44 family)
VTSDGNIDTFLLAAGGFLGFGATFLSALGGGGGDISTALLFGSIGMLAGVGLVKILVMTAHAVFRDARREKLAAAAATHKEEPQAPQESAPAAASEHNANHKP